MTLHIFNPEHDIALASGLTNFTAPHAGRQLRHDFGYIPALWADKNDIILVDDVEYAQNCYEAFHKNYIRKNCKNLPKLTPSQFVSTCQLAKMEITNVDPWGWDAALRQKLSKQVDVSILPSYEDIEIIRQLSHRRTAASILPALRTNQTIGEAFECNSVEEVDELLSKYEKLVLKAPWSSTGRGIRFLSTDHTPLSMQVGWLRNVLKSQGSIMVEPLYKKVKDFGMEFQANADGTITYLGLSLFHTTNGAYTGNIIATEKSKLDYITRYISAELLEQTKNLICSETSKLYHNNYVGPFGVDMMVVSDSEGFLLHPCVEINLRRTMGHVALSLKPLCNPTNDADIVRVMRIEYLDNNYKLKLQHI